MRAGWIGFPSILDVGARPGIIGRPISKTARRSHIAGAFITFKIIPLNPIIEITAGYVAGSRST